MRSADGFFGEPEAGDKGNRASPRERILILQRQVEEPSPSAIDENKPEALAKEPSHDLRQSSVSGKTLADASGLW
jgi:hypothetical protein